MMAGIRSSQTRIEVELRRRLWRAGFRYRVNARGLPGKPDLFLPKWKAVVLVNGCFWHGHDCALYRPPKSNAAFWSDKIAKNRARDLRNIAACREMGLRVFVVWECALRGTGAPGFELVGKQLARWMIGKKVFGEIRGAM
jgi:DNA mismatch endonuclease (patch repair protein)